MPNFWILICTLIGFLLLLVPIGWPGRWLGIVWLLPLWFYQPAKPAIGEVWLSLLDVGQGLAVVVQTATHTLVYDAGAKHNDNIDMGESVVLPYLRTLNIHQLDMLVISHGDNDHIGGAAALLAALPITSLITSVPEKFSTDRQARYCLAGQTWQWDDVQFSFLYPSPSQLHQNDNSSCVLRIDNGKQSILLSGDIEKSAEMSLLRMTKTPLTATILVAPHHGSKTSSTQAFIDAVRPQWVLYATGYRNRYHFPHPTVVNAYRINRAKQMDTAELGTIRVKLNRADGTPVVEAQRIRRKRYWQEE
jgi:competence protein ComEC